MIDRLLRLLVLAGLCAVALAVRAAEPGLLIDGSTQRVEAWPAVTVLAETDGEMDIAAAMALADRFEVPRSAYATLGLRKTPMWLRIPVSWTGAGGPNWMLDIDYAVLNRVDVYLVREGQVVQRARLGNMQPFSQRPVPSRSHALPLELRPGITHELYLRVQTQGAMILPITIMRPQAFHAEALDEHILQGFLAGLGLCLVIYSLVQWISTREPLFLKYAMLTTGSLMFSVVQFGIGGMYLWRDQLWFEMHGAALMALLASGSTFLFVEEVLRGPEMSRHFSRVMYAGAAALGLTAVLYALDLIHIHTVSSVIGSLGLLPALMGLPGAIRRARRGDPIGWYFLWAWLGYFVATAIMVGVIRGYIDASLWTLHAFQAGATLDMIIFMRVLGLRMRAIHNEARSAVRERDTFVSMAHTDPLTGLPNRRGLDARLAAEMAKTAANRLLAVYMIDLDGFKQVNDQHGHELGDELLIAVGRRLGSQLRSTDVVARLGGDEFVVTAGGLADERQARDLGLKLVEAFREPFLLSAGRQCSVGLTIGYVLVPLDGTDPVRLLRQADAAMYAGKQGGKGCVRRAQAMA
ncbi:diguanylate cyclase [uncultured Piscinibacter sp.]|uniref:diguanylate cyclase n=1 Tax=uncultured Piscinibacter sp. TaxID=1131835 RepID=UPI0026364CFE|nr:diguanylate cyclase [uncultured Piscinibacter sp.]